MKNLPIFLKRYFWDTDFFKLNKNSHGQFVIERILNYGDEKAVKWLFRYFKRSELTETLEKRRNISRLSANYWSLILNIPDNKILCLRKQSQSKPQKTWTY